jgi:signal transduction histidine kinase
VTVGDGIEATVTVTDTGAGIPAEQLPRIFERFYRVDGARDRNAGGSGLGLEITRRIVDAHGGTIAVDSEVGVGTTFVIRLPASALAGGG